MRQRDPLSPFLFAIVVDVLCRLLSREVNKGLVKRSNVGPQRVLVSHVQFAYDTIFFLEPDTDSFVNILVYFDNIFR